MCPLRSGFFLSVQRWRELQKPGAFPGTGQEARMNPPPHTHTSAVKPALIGVPSQRDTGQDVHAAERVIRLLMIFQNQHGRRGTASEARRERESDVSDISPGEEFVREAAALMSDKRQSDGLEKRVGRTPSLKTSWKILPKLCDAARKCWDTSEAQGTGTRRALDHRRRQNAIQVVMRSVTRLQQPRRRGPARHPSQIRDG